MEGGAWGLWNLNNHPHHHRGHGLGLLSLREMLDAWVSGRSPGFYVLAHVFYKIIVNRWENGVYP